MSKEPTAPIPYREEDDSKKIWLNERYGGPDPFDENLPSQKSFITDLIYTTRGIETPTTFTVWSGLFLLSTLIKREAWIKWFPGRFFANLYVILVGPAGSKKSTVIDDIGLPLMDMLQRFIKDPNIKALKRLNYVKNKISPEALVHEMIPSSELIPVKDHNGHAILNSEGDPVYMKHSSEMAIILSEMSVSISKRSYAEGIIQFMLDLYACHDEWNWSTIGRGKQTLENVYTTFLGATTTTGFRDSIPEAAVGDGFLSRNVIAYQPGYPRIRPTPFEIEEAPSFNELARRAAWIAENTIGEYAFSRNAYRAYEKWYYAFKKRLESAGDSASIQSRLDTQVRKVAFLLRAARYDDTDRLIHEQDFEDAAKLVRGTYQSSLSVLNEMSMDGHIRNVSKLEDYIKRNAEATRAQVMRGMRMPAQQLTQAVEQLFQQEKILIVKEDGAGNTQQLSAPSCKSDEKYVWRFDQ